MIIKKSRVIVVSLSSTLVKVVQATNAGAIEKVEKRSVQGGAVDAALRQALMGCNTKGAAFVCTVPGHIATTKNLEIPSVDPDEIESILALQATRHTPFNKDEILTSYIKLDSLRQSFTRVLMIVVKREAVKEQIAIMKNVGCPVETLLFAPEAVCRFYAKGMGFKKGDAPVAILDIDRQNTTFMVSFQGFCFMSRSIPVGIDLLISDPLASQQLADEVKVSLDVYEQESGRGRPAKLFLSRSHSAFAAVEAALAVGAVQVEHLPYTNFVQASKAVKDALTRDFLDDSALDVLSVAAMLGKCQAEILPQEMKDQRSMSEKGKDTLKAGVLLLIALILVGAALICKVYFKDQFLKQNLIAKYAEQRQQVQNLESMITRTRVLRQYLEGRGMPLDAIRELYRIIPQEIYLSSVNMDDAGNLSIQGVSDSMSKVFSFVTALEESDLFSGVKTKSTTTKKDRGKDVAVFEIIMKLGAGDVVQLDKKQDQK